MPDASPINSPDKSPEKDSGKKSPKRSPKKRGSAFDHLAAACGEALDAFKTVLGSRQRQDNLASLKAAVELQKSFGGPGMNEEIDLEIAHLQALMRSARTGRS